MLGAILLVHAQNGFFVNWFNTPGRGHGIECNLAYFAMAVSLMLTGGGPSRSTRSSADAGRISTGCRRARSPPFHLPSAPSSCDSGPGWLTSPPVP